MDFLTRRAGVLSLAALVLGIILLFVAMPALRIAKKLQKDFDSAVQGQQPAVNAALTAALKNDITFGGNVVIKKDLTVAGSSSVFGQTWVSRDPSLNPDGSNMCSMVCDK